VNLDILDIALGLVFLYLILSIITTAINELIAGWTHRRAKTLNSAIRQLLADPTVPGLAEQFYSHPLVKTLSEKNIGPSYIPSRTFALVVLDLLVPADPSGSRSMAQVRDAVAKLEDGSFVKRTLSALLDEAGDDLAQLQANVEIWFNSVMERVSGWYKRHTQVAVFAIAIIVSVATNADTIRVASTIAHDAALRDALVAQAEAFAETDTGDDGGPPADPNETVSRTAQSPQEKIKASLQELDNMGIPLGWKQPYWPDAPMQQINLIFGLMMTATALSLGAPFWFDMLNKIVNIRAAGRSPEEQPKGPEAKAKRVEEIPPQ